MSKIASVKDHPIVVELKTRYWTAHEGIATWSVIIVEVQTDDGVIGYGEIHGSPQKGICTWVERLGEYIKGMDANAHLPVWEKMFGVTHPRRNGIMDQDGMPPPPARSEFPQVLGALGGIDIALWDIKGKLAGLPVYKLLGAENRPILSYSTGGYYREGAPDNHCAEEMAGFIAKGYKAVKLKTGAGPLDVEIGRIKATREAIGKDNLLMLDVSGAFSVHEAIRFAQGAEPYDITWFEEPLHWYCQPADYLQLAEATTIPIAHGERLTNRFTCRDFITSGGIGYIQFDATRFCGFTESIRVAELANQLNVKIAPHHAPEIHSHLVAAYPEHGFGCESHGDPERDPTFYHLFSERAQIKDGYVHMNDKPGFGIEIDRKFMERYKAK